MSKSVKICILYSFVDKPFGGGNQFLKALGKYFSARGVFEKFPWDADVILFNSHHDISAAAKARLNYPDKIFIHRIDGPMKLYAVLSDRRDKIVYEANNFLADATIFQSEWSKQQNYKLGFKGKKPEFVIINAPDPAVFNLDGKIPFSSRRKIKLIAISWSSNWKKGFDVYGWLDENLDFEKYEMSFVGNSPIKFKNIKHLQPLQSIELSKVLKNSDIFIAASQNDPCSNSLIEALHCGLPSLVLNSGGHPEIVRQGGEIFEAKEQIPSLLEKIINNYSDYVSSIKVQSIEEVGKAYYDFIQEVYDKSSHKKFGKIAYLRLITEILFWKTVNKIRCR